ncbi:MAG: peroxiredoxin-like family protein [Nodosilinea sp.]
MSTQTAVPAIRLIPGDAVPALTVKTLGGKRWNVADQTPQNFTLVVFYRGLHCPLCAEYLQELEQKLDQFGAIGVEAIAISGDDHSRAVASVEKWNLQRLTIGYGLTRDAMRDWGLYVSRGELEGEPDFFNEPGLFLIRPDGVLFFAGVNNAPYGRTDLATLLGGLDYVLNHSYPLRGTEV